MSTAGIGQAMDRAGISNDIEAGRERNVTIVNLQPLTDVNNIK